MLKLRFTNNPQSAIWLVEPKVVLGSSATSDLVLAEEGIEAQHAEILVNHEDLLFRLLSDSAVITLNDKSVELDDPVRLNVGDKLRLGKVELEVIDPKREPKNTASADASRVPSGWALKANHTALSNRVYPLNGEVVIGRSSECDIALAAAHLSRRHAQIYERDGGLYVKDLNSSNGTYLNGQRINEARIKRGDELRFDTLSFGVIGPADELDKTTVRSVAVGSVRQTPRVQKPQSAPVKANGSIKVSKSSVPTPPAARPTTATAQKPELANSSMDKRRRAGPMVTFGLLVIIAAGAFIAWQNLSLPG